MTAAISTHTRLHDIDDTADHNGVSGATENNFISFDANGLPKDSTKNDSSYADADHDATHIRAGSDEIDGDKLDIDWNPTNYTPTTSPTEADNADNLTAHLAGIDAELANAHSSTDYRSIVIDGGGSAITTGRKVDFMLPAGTITGVYALADQSTSTVIDIWKCSYADYDNSTYPADGGSITSATPVTITTAHKATDTTLTSWTTAVVATNVYTLNVDSNDNATRVTIIIKMTLS